MVDSTSGGAPRLGPCSCSGSRPSSPSVRHLHDRRGSESAGRPSRSLRGATRAGERGDGHTGSRRTCARSHLLTQPHAQSGPWGDLARFEWPRLRDDEADSFPAFAGGVTLFVLGFLVYVVLLPDFFDNGAINPEPIMGRWSWATPFGDVPRRHPRPEGVGSAKEGLHARAMIGAVTSFAFGLATYGTMVGMTTITTLVGDHCGPSGPLRNRQRGDRPETRRSLTRGPARKSLRGARADRPSAAASRHLRPLAHPRACIP